MNREALDLYMRDLSLAMLGVELLACEMENEMGNKNITMDDMIVRVHVSPNSVHVFLLGLKTLDYDLKDVYDSVDDLPKWVQERLALLMMISTNPPTAVVKGVGRRISENIFWVFPPENVAG